MATRPVPVVEGLPPSRAEFEARYLKRQRPVVLKGAAPLLVPKAWALFHDEGEGGDWAATLGRILGDAAVDVAMTHWSQAFNGASSQAESARMTFPAFLAMLRDAPESDEAALAGFHDDDSWGRHNFYLAQSSIFERPRQQQGGGPPATPPPLAALAPHIDMPDALVDPRDVMAVNLWMGGKPTATTLHYDSNHNLLVVLRGRKQAQLFPPSATPRLHAYGIYTASANHSGLAVPAEPHDLFREGAQRVEGCTMEPWVARLEAGDVLFLPQGWWHQVDSGTRTVALNYWTAGFVENVLDGGAHRRLGLDGAGGEQQGQEQQAADGDDDGDGDCDGDRDDGDDVLPFYLRAVVQRAVERERARMVRAAVGKALAECRQKLGRGEATEKDELSAADWRRLVDEACALVPTTPSSPEVPSAAPALMQAVLCAMPFTVQLAELPRAVEKLGLDRWLGTVLMKLDPITVEVLTTGWEGGVDAGPEEVAAFFYVIYGHALESPGNLCSTQEWVKIQLFRSKNLLAEAAMRQALGLDSESK